MSTRFKTLHEFFYPEGRKIRFLIPNYQRGYKWGVKESDQKDSSAEYLVRELVRAWRDGEDADSSYFLQGITVTEDGDVVSLIDGQQRMTTFYLLLRILGIGYVSGCCDIDLQYEIREDSQNFIASLKDETFDWRTSDDTHSQDIFYFKKALDQMSKIVEEEGLAADCDQEETTSTKKFVDFLFYGVSFLYIVVDRNQAVNTFAMMNGHKATMHQEELVKAQMLHEVSEPIRVDEADRPATFVEAIEGMKELAAVEWESDSLRSRYAREWDKWLYWWNRKDVRSFFKSGKDPLGLLLKYYSWERSGQNGKLEFDFSAFRRFIEKPSQTKDVFKRLRDTQRGFEDAFNTPLVHNYLKLSLICVNGGDSDRFEVLHYFLDPNTTIEKMREYANWRLVGASHKAIVGDGMIGDSKVRTKEECAREVYEKLRQNVVYGKADEDAFRQLLRLNVEEYNRLNAGLGAHFDFSIWEHRSLEHIYPKSRFYHHEMRDGVSTMIDGNGNVISTSEGRILSEEYFKRGDVVDGGEHCIGNLVLLYKDDNSQFGPSSFEEKKRIFFDMNPAKVGFKFASRNLLHSIAAFSKSEWGADEIRENRNEFLSRFKSDYTMTEVGNEAE